MGEARVTNPLVDQFRRGGVPKELRQMAAEGALPLKPEDLIELWTDLLHDSDPEIKATAAKSLGSFPASEFLPILKSRETPPAILAWAVAHRTERNLREVTLQNTSLTDEAIEPLAGSLSEELAELVVINQTRLLRRTSLLEALEGNPSLNNDQRRRLRELRETFHIGEAPAPPPPPPAAPPPPPPPEPVEMEVPPLSEHEAVTLYLSEEEQQHAEKVSAVQKIYRLNMKDKLEAAFKGNREERAILVRDPNPLVSAAVIGNPRVTDTEAEAFAGMRNVSDGVLKYIGKRRDWTKRYAVVLNLVRNPRTPLATSLSMVSRLLPTDLRKLAVDKNVPEAIRKNAQNIARSVEPGAQQQRRH